jgi:hypothetical protein
MPQLPTWFGVSSVGSARVAPTTTRNAAKVMKRMVLLLGCDGRCSGMRCLQCNSHVVALISSSLELLSWPSCAYAPESNALDTALSRFSAAAPTAVLECCGWLS